MSKEYLEALETYSKLSLAYQKKIDNLEDWNKLDISYKVIKQALQRLESIESSKPNEALKWLEHTGEQWVEHGLNDDVVQYKETQSYREIKQALIKSQEQEKVLEILFKKEVDINLLSRSIDFKTYNHSYAYIKGYNFSENNEITGEEYNLLTRYYNE